MSTTAAGTGIKGLADFDTPTIANAMESLGLTPLQSTSTALQAMTARSTPIVGIAVTATMTAQWGGRLDHIEPWLAFLDSIEREPLPVVAVYQDTSPEPGREAMIGEGMSRAMIAAGAVGAICDGAIRDIQALRELTFPVLARGLTPDRGRIRFHLHGVDVTVAGMHVTPGDLIHADENGAVVVPMEHAAEIAAAAAEVARKEARLFEMISRPEFRVADMYAFYADALRTARAARKQGEF